jgi:hypothetical protein
MGTDMVLAWSMMLVARTLAVVVARTPAVVVVRTPAVVVAWIIVMAAAAWMAVVVAGTTGFVA